LKFWIAQLFLTLCETAKEMFEGKQDTFDCMLQGLGVCVF
jgi:hypothetical protein